MSALLDYEAEVRYILADIGKFSKKHAVAIFNGGVFPLAAKLFKSTKKDLANVALKNGRRRLSEKSRKEISDIMHKAIGQQRFMDASYKMAMKVNLPHHTLVDQVARLYAAFTAYFIITGKTPPKITAKGV